ncbi:hypothetical protein QO198_06475 [Pseudoalteromonas distincta]|uniref:hypothetical protein n=1 Tax=Pseudoalteromonas distincta TaxID=77608 RepID=UPI00352E6FCB
MKIIFAALLLLSSGVSANNYQEEVDKFFELYADEKTSDAVDSIYASNKYVSSIPDQVKQIKTQLSSLDDLVGEINFISKVSDYKVGELFVHVTYLVTYDRQPIRFEFQFFKVKEGWRIYSMSFDDNIDEDIKELARKAALKN